MYKAFYIFITNLLISGAIQVCAQTHIQEKHYMMSYLDNNNCITFDYDMKVPYLSWSDNSKDIRKIINDSIINIAKACFAYTGGNPSNPKFELNENICDEMAIEPDIANTTMEYKILRNDFTCLSIDIEVTANPKGAGAGVIMKSYYFNIDLINNQFINIDSLFSPLNKEKVLKLLEAKFDSTQNLPYDAEEDMRLDGINISDHKLIAHYSSEYLPARHRLTYEIELALPVLKNYLNKKCNWVIKWQPKIQFDLTTYDYGIIEKRGLLLKEFQFKNIGEAPLIISKVLQDGGCTAQWPKDPILPGKNGVIKIFYDGKVIGKFDKSITVESNDASMHNVLKIKGEVISNKTQK